MKIEFDSSIKIIGATDSDDLVYEVTETPSASNPTVTQIDNKDTIIAKSSSSGVSNDFVLNGTFSITNQTPELCDVTAGNLVTGKSIPGNARLLLSNGYCQKIFSRNMVVGNSITYNIDSFKPTSLRAHMYQSFTDAFAGVTKGFESQRAGLYGSKLAWNAANGVSGGDVGAWTGSYGGVNPNNFLRTSRGSYIAPPLDVLDQVLDTSIVGVGWAMWITPHHYMTWRGHGIGDGTNYKQINGEMVVQYSPTAWTGNLCKFLPSNYASYLPTLNYNSAGNKGIPVFARLYNTYDGKADASAVRRVVQPGDFYTANRLAYTSAAYAELDNYQFRSSKGQIATGGDSGSPVFTVIKGQLIAIGNVSYAGTFGSWFYSDYLDKIQQLVSALNGSGNYTIQTIDLSEFATY